MGRTSSLDTETHTSVGAVILTGGRSVRMGVDKSLLKRPDGRTQLNYLKDCLEKAGVGNIIVSTAHNTSEHSVGEVSAGEVSTTVSDVIRDGGPLAGIHAAITYYLTAGDDSDHLATPNRLIVVPCDMPRLQPELFQMLCEHRHTTAFSGSFFPLIITDLKANKIRLENIFSGNREPSIRNFLMSADAEVIHSESNLEIQNNLINTNTPEDWDHFLKTSKIESN